MPSTTPTSRSPSFRTRCCRSRWAIRSCAPASRQACARRSRRAGPRPGAGPDGRPLNERSGVVPCARDVGAGARACGVLLVLAALRGTGGRAGPGLARLDAHGSVEQVYATGAARRARCDCSAARGDSPRASGRLARRRRLPRASGRVRLPRARRRRALWPADGRERPVGAADAADLRPAAAGRGVRLSAHARRDDAGDRRPPARRPPPVPTRRSSSTPATATPTRPGPESGIATIANLLGFAVVDVNMRGTGCSGGSFDYFESLQSLDGYDVIETVARQPWVLGHRVGMMGISYGGISQLFVAATDPPHLAAIAPLSVIDNSATTLYPGGILNTGFAVAWARERAHDALAGFADGRPVVGVRADPAWRSDMPGEPGIAWRGAEHHRPGPGQPVLRAGGGRPAGSGDVRPPHPCPGVPRLPVDGRADGCSLRRSRPAFLRHPSPVVHLHQRRPQSTRWIRRRSPAGMTSWSCTSPIGCRGCRMSARAGAGGVCRGDRESRGSRFLRIPSSQSRRTPPRWPPSSGWRPVRVLFDNGRGRGGPGVRHTRRSSVRSRGSRCPAPRPARGIWEAAGR